MRRAATLCLVAGEALLLAPLLGAPALVAVYGMAIMLFATPAVIAVRTTERAERWYERAPRVLAVGLLVVIGLGIAVEAVRDGGATGLLQIAFAAGALLLAAVVLARRLPAP